MPEIDLQPHEYRPDGEARLYSRRYIKWLGVLAVVMTGVSTYAMYAVGAPWLRFLPWPFVFLAGSCVGYLRPQTFFRKDD